MAITKVSSGLISADASSIDLNIDAGTLYLDVSENRVGIGTTSPSTKLEVAGDVKLGAVNPMQTATNSVHGTSGEDGFLVRTAVSAATSPTYSNIDDTNTGMFFAAADTLGFTTAGSERIRIDSSGNVGIGTSSITTFDGYKTLHFKNTGGNAIALTESDGGVISQTIAKDSGGGQVLIGARSNHPTVICQNDTERMRIDSSGNLLVAGTSAGTNGKLQVTGDIGLTGSCTIRQSTNSDTGNTLRFLGTQFVAGALNSQSYLYSGGGQIASVSASANALLLEVGGYSGSGHRLKVQNDSGGVNGTLTYTGKVGIGYTSPTSTIHLGDNDDIGFGGGTKADFRISYVSASNSLGIKCGTGGDAVDVTLTPTADLTIAGSLSKGSGSFRIDHPLESKADTHHLVHSFVEAPQADNIYRGKVDLVDGSAIVNIDTVAGMTEGTFIALNTDVQCFTTNETDWDAVKGSVSGNILTISCQNSSSTATVSWLVIGERHDQHMIDTEWTDENGKVIVEPLKEETE